jgi:hypothetical protein
VADQRDLYSPERRTALVLTGTGADGAYHAGVLRALHEVGVKIDLVAGRGIGAAAAILSSVDGASRLWDARGLWQVPVVVGLYAWRLPIRLLGALVLMVAIVFAAPAILLALAVLVYPLGLLLGMLGLDVGSALVQRYLQLLTSLFQPGALPTWVPRLVAMVAGVTVFALTLHAGFEWWRTPYARRQRGSRIWTLVGAPLDQMRALAHFARSVWDLLRGGHAPWPPVPEEFSRRFSELLSENLGQPGFKELLLVVHDLDARRDLVFGMLRPPYHAALFPSATSTGPRRAEAFDLSSHARADLLHVLQGALSPAVLTEPALVKFAPDGYWRGEVHRLVDRPASLGRLLEEVAAAGAEQVIVVAATPNPTRPHELVPSRVDARGRLSEHISSAEASALDDALRQLEHRFRGVYVIRPEHNPVQALDFDGAYDVRSDRHQSLAELMAQGHEDASRSFIERILGASGERLSWLASDGRG